MTSVIYQILYMLGNFFTGDKYAKKIIVDVYWQPEMTYCFF